MDQNASSSSLPSSSTTRVQLPSIRNLLVETQHPPLPVYRSLQVAPELAPLSQQRRTNEDTGTLASRPLHASPPPVPPPRFSNAVSATLPGSPFGLHGQQQLPQSAGANDVMQAPASRAGMSSAPGQSTMRSRQGSFRGQYLRADNPNITASSTTMDSRLHSGSPDNNSIHPTIHHGHAYRQSHAQGQGTNSLLPNARSNRYSDVPTFAYPSTPDRNSGSHATVHDLRSMSTSESQSHRGGQLQKISPERFRTPRSFEQQEEYDSRNSNTSWGSQGRHSRASLDEWDASSGHSAARSGIANGPYAPHYESYDPTTTGRERGYPYSPAGPSQRGREPVGYHRQGDNEYVSRSPQNLRPMQWDSRYPRENGYASSSARALYHSTTPLNVPPLAIRHRSHGSSYSPPAAASSGAGTSHEWQTRAPGDRSYRTEDYSIEDEYATRSSQPYPSPVAGQMNDRVLSGHPHAERYIRGSGSLQSLPGRMNDPHSSRFPRDELPGVLAELTNEARAATQEGKAMRKIRDFSNTLMQFALHARHQAPLTTPEAVQEMSHRAELMYRMARELRKWKKATIAKPVEPPKEVPRAAPKQQVEKKKPLTKEEKRNLDDLEKIKKKRASAQAGIKSKYMKRNKKTPPPKKCSSCGIRDTPEWRKGPDGPRSLCNACGLHYAKLMRNRAANEGRWVGNGPPPPIDIITLRQVTGVGIQPQETARGEYEIPGVYENIPASHVMQGAVVRRSNPGSAASSVNPSSKPSSSITVRIDEATVTAAVAAKSRSASTNDSTATEKPSDPVPVESSTVESSADGKGKKRKADDLEEEEGTVEDPDHPAKRRRLSSPRMEDIQMHPSTSVESLPASTNSSRATQTEDSTAEHSY